MDVGITVVKTVDVPVIGESVVVVTVVVEGVDKERQEQAVESSLELQLCRLAGTVYDDFGRVELESLVADTGVVIAFVIDEELNDLDVGDVDAVEALKVMLDFIPEVDVGALEELVEVPKFRLLTPATPKVVAVERQVAESTSVNVVVTVSV